MTEEKTCGNCNFDLFDEIECDKFKDRHQCVKAKDWEPDLNYLKEFYAKHQKHEFNPKDRGTWPEIEKKVIVGNRAESWLSARVDDDGEWFDDNNQNLTTRGFVVKWWSYLPD
jgi:hypothetical protein